MDNENTPFCEKFYRHADYKKGFRIYEQYSLRTPRRDSLVPVIDQINSLYTECSRKQDQIHRSQPTHEAILTRSLVLMCFSLLMLPLLESKEALACLFLAIFSYISWITADYLKRSSLCEAKHESASRELRKNFFRQKRQFEKRNPGLGVALEREQNCKGEILKEWLEIYSVKLQNIPESVSPTDAHRWNRSI